MTLPSARTLKVMASALAFGLLYWLADSVYEYYAFRENLRFMLFQEHLSFLDSLLLNVPEPVLFNRLAFLLACLAGGGLVALYLEKYRARTRELRRSEERLRHVLENMPILLDAFDEEGRVLVWNRECERATGYTAEEIRAAEDPLALLYPDDEERARLLAELERRWGNFRDWEWEVTSKSGEKRVISWSNLSTAVPVPGWHTWAVGTDITDRYRAEEGLARSRERIAEILDSISDGFFSLDEDYTVTYFNQAAADLLGRVPDEVLGRNLFQAFPEARGSVFEEKYTQAMEEKVPVAFETYFDRPPYENWYDVSVYPQRRGISVYFQVTTARHRAEEALRDSEERLQLALDAAEDGVWDLRFAGEELFLSSRWYRMLGYEPGSLPARYATVLELVHPEDRPALETAVQRCREGTAASFETEYRMRTREGAWRWILGRAKVVEWTDRGRPARLVGTHVDISERKEYEQTLRQRQAELQMAQRLARLGNWEFDIQSGTITWSEEMYTLFHRDPSLGPPSFEEHRALLHPDDVQRCMQTLERALAAGEGYQVEFRLQLPDGEIRHLQTVAEPRQEEEGPPRGYYGTTQDITEQKRAAEELQERYEEIQSQTEELEVVNEELRIVNEESNRLLRQLREQEGLLRLIVEQSPVGVAMFDTEMRYLVVSRSWIEGMKPTTEELVGRCHYEVFADEIPAHWREAYARGLSGEVLKRAEDAFPRRDGGTDWLRWEIHPWRTGEGSVGGIICFAEDITDRKRAADELRRAYEEREELDRIVSLGPVVLFLWRNEPGWPVEFVTGNVQRFGYAVEDLCAPGVVFADLVHPDDLPEVERHVGEQLAEGADEFTFEYRLLLPDGEPRWVREHSLVRRDGAGQVTHFQGLLADITEEKLLTEQLRQAEKMQAVSELAGGIAHDFNNQLGGIMGYAEMLAARLEEPALSRYAEQIVRTCERAADLTSQLLAFARRGKYRSLVVSVHELVDEVASLLAHSIDKRIDLQQELRAAPDTVRGDPTQLQNVLLNIGLNARDAMPEGGELRFETAIAAELPATVAGREGDEAPAAGPYVRITVRDTGNGMEAETARHIFEPFFTTKEAGTGMGLAAVYGTVKNHHGAVAVESAPGEGTSFHLYFPLVRDPAALPEPAPAGDAALPGGEGRHILLVDDEESIREIGAELLQELGYRVTLCGEGQEAVARFQEGPDGFDLVVLDMVMPGAGGAEVFRRLRAIRPDVRVLLSSGYTADGEARELLGRGALGFLQKPFRLGQVSQKVAAALAAAPPGKDAET
jgi:PAS domain S-box-containing protein